MAAITSGINYFKLYNQRLEARDIININDSAIDLRNESLKDLKPPKEGFSRPRFSSVQNARRKLYKNAGTFKSRHMK